jgi:hypothetical protein
MYNTPYNITVSDIPIESFEVIVQIGRKLDLHNVPIKNNCY